MKPFIECGCWPLNSEMRISTAKFCSHGLGGADGARFGFVAGSELEEVGEGWEDASPPFPKLPLIEIAVVLIECEDDGRVIWQKSLYHDVTVVFATPNTAGHLVKKLEHTFFGLIVWQVESIVGLKDANNAQPWDVKTFGKNLRANHDVDVAVVNFLVTLVERLIGGAVGIKAGDVCPGESLANFVLDEFSANTAKDNTGVSAFGAVGRYIVSASADMA